jgi:tRNA1Val (adenine37-N6)-methyltransferase
VFRFKEFSINDSDVAMKVGTDGVLLGAWSRTSNPKKILDVGCGTGLIALQLAQRFPSSNITAIDIDDRAYKGMCFCS